jgi:hypothetical protein
MPVYHKGKKLKAYHNGKPLKAYHNGNLILGGKKPIPPPPVIIPPNLVFEHTANGYIYVQVVTIQGGTAPFSISSTIPDWLYFLILPQSIQVYPKSVNSNILERSATITITDSTHITPAYTTTFTVTQKGIHLGFILAATNTLEVLDLD